MCLAPSIKPTFTLTPLSIPKEAFSNILTDCFALEPLGT